MTDLVASRPHGVGDGPEGLSLCPQSDHFADSLLLSVMPDEFAIVAAPEPEGNLPAEIPASGLLIGLDLPNSLAALPGSRKRRI